MTLIDIETGEAIVNAVFEEDRRAMKTFTQLGSWRPNKDFLTAKQVRRVRTTKRIVQLLEDCHLGPNDKLTEYSTWFQNLRNEKKRVCFSSRMATRTRLFSQ